MCDEENQDRYVSSSDTNSKGKLIEWNRLVSLPSVAANLNLSGDFEL